MIRKNHIIGLLAALALMVTIPIFAATIITTPTSVTAFVDSVADCAISYQIYPAIKVACPSHTSLFQV